MVKKCNIVIIVKTKGGYKSLNVKCNLNLMKCNVCIEAISVMEVNKMIYNDMIAQTKEY